MTLLKLNVSRIGINNEICFGESEAIQSIFQGTWKLLIIMCNQLGWSDLY